MNEPEIMSILISIVSFLSLRKAVNLYSTIDDFKHCSEEEV
jgi:hypothetical protein